MSTTEEIRNLLAERNLVAFVGRKEDLWFEAKPAGAYDLESPGGRWELAKDTSGLANAEGGFLVVGLSTRHVPDEQTDQVVALDLLTEESFIVPQVEGVVREYLYPHPQGLHISWVENRNSAGQGVGVVYVPTQPQDRRFTLIARVVDDGTQLRRFVFGLVLRHKSANIPLTVKQLHDLCQNGRSTNAQRLTRMETKLDQLIALGEQTSSEQPQAVQNIAEVVQERLNKIIADAGD